MDYLNTLNDVQKQAVEQTEGPLLVIAGPGSGKTRVLTFRIAHLIHKGVDPFNILALTFTNKSAKEMKERVISVTGENARNLWIGTFHSVFAKILRTEHEKIGYPRNFTIYDTTDTKSLIKALIKEEGLNDDYYKPNQVLSRISLAKNNLFTPKAYANNPTLMAEDEAAGRPRLAELYDKYTKRCYKAGAMDFDDLLLKTFLLLETSPEALHKYQHLFRYVLIDEFQDTNYVQMLIVQKLAAVHENICCVGDDAQSIYAFRGANIQNILTLERKYPDLKTFKLEQNYRSVDTIVQTANQIIQNNKGQVPKKIWTDNPTGDKVKVLRAMSDHDEARMVSDIIFEEKVKCQAQPKDFAILYRTNAQSRAFEEWLRKLNLKYKIYGGLSFYQRKEIKDVMSYIRLIINPKDEEALKRVINYPTRGIGATTLQKCIIAAVENDFTLWDILDNISLHKGLNARAKNSIDAFVTMIKAFMAMEKNMNAYEIIHSIVKQTGILKELHNDKTVEGVSRYENLQELLNSVKDFTASRSELVDESGAAANTSLAAYMEEVSLLTDTQQDDDDDNKISLMTIHSAKGLEFPYVFVVGLEDELFPSQLSLTSRTDLEEERRLFYVAVTRAEKKLFLTYAQTRYRFGNLNHCEASRFLKELDPNSMEMVGLQMNTSSLKPLAQPQEKKSYHQEVNTHKKSNLKPLSKAKKPAPVLDNFTPSDTSCLQAGMQILHSKFGQGKVLAVDGSPDHKIATIFFPSQGQKKIMLKYAQLQIL